MKQVALYLLIGICLLAGTLRFFALQANPASLTWDEVAWGYNAYSLGFDGKDEFGKFLPFEYIESFGDFKPPLYAYLTILPVKLFGLNEFSTRFASAFFGTLTVLVAYFLVKRIFYTSSRKEYYALLTAFLLAISPWHIMLSRAAFEANLVTFFLITGTVLFLKGIQEKDYYIILSVIPFAASFYTFNTARIVTPLIVLLLGISFLKPLFIKKRNAVIMAGILGILLVGPLVPFLFSEQASLRFKEVNIFSDISVIERVNTEVSNDNNAFWSKLLHHRYLTYSVEFLKHYLDHFNPNFLFVTGDNNPKFSTQDVGQLYYFEIPFFIIGILMLIRRKEGYWWIIPLWLLIGIIPAATARETPHALRIEATLPAWQIFTAVGLTTIFIFLYQHKKQIFRPALILLSIVILFNCLYYLHGYYFHYPREYSSEWQYGYKESITYVTSQKNNYDEIYITDALGRPYIYYLFYEKTDPKDFRRSAEVNRDVFGFVKVDSFGKYHFKDKISPKEGETKKILYVTLPQDVPESAQIIKEFKLLNGNTQLVAYTL